MEISKTGINFAEKNEKSKSQPDISLDGNFSLLTVILL